MLGVNVGQMGYLTEVEPSTSTRALDRLVAGDYEVAERMVLEITVESDGTAQGRWYALNEAVLEKVHTGRLVRLDVEINGTFVHDVRGRRRDRRDAHRLHRVLVLRARPDRVAAAPVPAAHAGVAAHAVRPLARARRPRRRCASVVCDDRSVVLTADGRELGELAAGDTVTCSGGAHPARIVTFGPRDFHQILKAKFGLSDR